MQDASGHGILVFAVEDVSELGLSSQNNAQDQTTIHFEVGQDTQDAQHVRTQVVSFIEQKHRPTTGVREIAFELDLELMQQRGERASALYTADTGDLAIHVALVDGGALDVVGDV